MINNVYQLVKPGVFSVKYEDVSFGNEVIVKPRFMAICHADQRYYLGKRDFKKLKNKLPMALIHECVGEILYDTTNTYKPGQKVVMIPNMPPKVGSEVIYENYAKGSAFRSSGYDGFMRELVTLPIDRVVAYNGVQDDYAAITEFVSVAAHAVKRFSEFSHEIRGSIGIWGDGSLAYVLACVIKTVFPEAKLTVVGKDSYKLSQFMFADNAILAEDLDESFNIDHAFECAGGEGSYYAIDDIIKYINPQGCVMLLGVSENKVAINTRDVLEKGLSFVGCSRSGRIDFENAVNYMENTIFQKRISRIIYRDSAVSSVEDIHRAFKTDLNTPFKTVFEWNL